MAVAGRMAGPYPSKVREAMSRSPSISAAGNRVIPSGRVDRVELVAEGGAREREDELHLGQVLEAERTFRVGHGVALGDHEHEVLLEQQPGHQIPAARGAD